MSVQVLVAATSTRLTTVAAVQAQLTAAGSAVTSTLIDAASAAIAAHCHRVWGQETVLETVPGSGNIWLGLSRTPVSASGTVLAGTVTEDGTPITDYSVDDAVAGRLYRANGWAGAVVRGWDAVAYSSGYIQPQYAAQRYAVTYVGGYICPREGGTVTVTLPSDVQQACVETVKAWYAAQDRDPALTRVQVGDVSESYGQVATTVRTTPLPPLAEALLRPWVRAPFEAGQ